MWGLAYVLLVWTLIVVGCGLLAFGLVFGEHRRSWTGMALLLGAVVVIICAAMAEGLSGLR